MVYKTIIITVVYALTPRISSNALPQGDLAVLDVQNNASVTILATSKPFTELYIQVYTHIWSSKS